MRWWSVVAVCTWLWTASAASIVFPPDASVLLTVERGTIVGVGAIRGGTHLRLEIIEGFEGAARMTFVAPGQVVTVDVVVGFRMAAGGGVATVVIFLDDGTSLAERLAADGLEVVWVEDLGDPPRASGILGSSASERGLERSNPRAEEGGREPGREPGR